MRHCFPLALYSFIVVVGSCRVQALLDCTSLLPCQKDSDCIDTNNVLGLKANCGNAACDAASGRCEYAAWNDADTCGNTNFVECAGNDDKCIKGPSGLNYQGACTGWGNNECVYSWCPGDLSAPTTLAPVTPPTVPAPTPDGVTLCQRASDCNDPTNEAGLDGTCGDLACAGGVCEYAAYNSTGSCVNSNFVECGGDDTKCNKGPRLLKYQGSCTGYENNECIYTFLLGDLKPPPTSAPTNAPTETIPPDTNPPEFRMDLATGIAGQALTLSGFDFGPAPGEIQWGGLSCPVTFWSRRIVKAYIGDTATPATNGIVMTTADGRVSLPQSFTVMPPLVLTQPGGEPRGFGTWAKTARIGGAGVYSGMPDSLLNQILDDLVLQEVSVVECDSQLSNYLSDAQFDAEIELMRRVSNSAHQRGLHIVWYYPALEVITPYGETIPNTMFTDHPDWVQYGIDGEANVFYGGAGHVFWVDEGAESAWMSPSSLGYRAYFIDRIRRLVKYAGIDGLWLDVPIYADFGPTPWSDTNDDAKAQFRADTGLDIPTAVDWSDPVFRRWIEWRHKEIARFLQDVTAAVREIDPDFCVIAETLPTDYNGGTIYGLDGGYLKNVNGITHVWEVDTMSNTVGMRKAQEDDWISFISAMKYTRGASGSKPSWVFSYGIQEDDGEKVMAQALIAGNNPYELKVPEMATTVGAAFRARMFGWTKENASYLFESTSLATVGILYSSGSRDYVDKMEGLGMFATWDGAGDPLWWAMVDIDSAYQRDYLAEHRGMVELLVNEHIPFDVLVFPDLAELASYDTVILPNVQSLSDAEAELIRQFVANGGHIVATGPNPGGLDKYGKDRIEYALTDVMGGVTKAFPMVEKLNDYGDGHSTYFYETHGKFYFTGEDAKESGRKLNEAVRSNIEVSIGTDADRRIHMELSSLGDEIVLQCSNFVGADGTLGFADVSHSFTVNLTVPEGKQVERMKHTSPDFSGRESIGFTQVDRQVTFSLMVKQYSMVVVSFVGAKSPVTNHVPSPGHDYLQTLVNQQVSFSTSVLLSNDGDLDGDTVHTLGVWPTAATMGTLSDLVDGTHLYTPPINFTGIDILAYGVSDGRGGTNMGRINILVEAPSQKYYPLSVSPLQGSTKEYGALNGLVATDTDTYGIRSNQDAVDWEVNTRIMEAIDVIASVEVIYSGHYSKVGVWQEVSLYNFIDKTWDLKFNSNVGDYDVPVSVVIDDETISRYVSSAGEMHTRIRGTLTGTGSELLCFANTLYWKITVNK